jgi:hypothetical protein
MLITSLIMTPASLLLEFLKKNKQPKQLKSEFRNFVSTSEGVESIPADIRAYLLSIIFADKNDHAKFNEEQIAEAARILDRAGPGAFYWMSEIATQLAFLASAQVNGIPTNVGARLGNSASPEEIVKMIVKI